MRSNEMYQGQPKVVKGKEVGLTGEAGERDYQFIPFPVPVRPESSEWYNSTLHKSLKMSEEEAEFWCTYVVKAAGQRKAAK